jgi:hypothetical protein
MLSSADIKRKILMDSGNSEIRKRIDTAVEEGALTSDDVLEFGEAFEAMVKTKGWLFFERRMLQDLDPIILVNGNEETKIRAKARIQDMQWIDLMIKERDRILEETNKDKAA